MTSSWLPSPSWVCFLALVATPRWEGFQFRLLASHASLSSSGNHGDSSLDELTLHEQQKCRRLLQESMWGLTCPAVRSIRAWR
jgi:hypothetical protein